MTLSGVVILSISRICLTIRHRRLLDSAVSQQQYPSICLDTIRTHPRLFGGGSMHDVGLYAMITACPRPFMASDMCLFRKIMEAKSVDQAERQTEPGPQHLVSGNSTIPICPEMVIYSMHAEQRMTLCLSHSLLCPFYHTSISHPLSHHRTTATIPIYKYPLGSLPADSIQSSHPASSSSSSSSSLSISSSYPPGGHPRPRYLCPLLDLLQDLDIISQASHSTSRRSFTPCSTFVFRFLYNILTRLVQHT